MDTSEQYIKMCEKAEEIQKGLILPPIMYFYDNRERLRPIGVCTDGSFVYRKKPSKDCPEVWLPRQDQLQEMICNNVEELIDDMNRFLEWIDFEIYNEYSKQFTSMEQLWLAFVMKEKYNKKWNGTEWVPDE